MNTAQKGASFENKLLGIAIQKGVILGMRGASSKSRSRDKDLKIDLILIKGMTLYLIQAKNHKKRASKPERERFYEAIKRNNLVGRKLITRSMFIEDEETFKELLEE